MNLLFICTKNQIRSLTAEVLFKQHPQHTVRSAGTALDARVRVSAQLLAWADVVLVMERKHEEIIWQKFAMEAATTKVVCLGIKDEYQYMDEELVEVLKDAVETL
jgi:predicted protein tyrosine phosphatase